MNTLDEATLVKEICRHLDASIAHLPVSTQCSLDAGRQAALMQREQLVSASDEGLAASVSRELEQNHSVSPEIEARLNQIRHSAVARYEELQQETTSVSIGAWFRAQFASFNFAAPAGMLATACLLVTAISLFYVNARPTGTLTLEEEIGLVATAEDIELYENLEFYMWLAVNESLTL